MEKKDYPNTAVAFVESGIFAREGVENLQAQGKPILKVKANVDGRDVEIGLFFKMVYDDVAERYTDEYYLTKNGAKMLTGKVEDPYVGSKDGESKNEFEDDIPF